MKRRWAPVFALSLSAPLLGGSCKHKDEVEMQNANSQPNGAAPAPATPLRAHPPTAAWHAAVRGTVLAAPVGGGGLVVVASVAPGNAQDAGAVEAFDSRTGAPRWSFDGAAGLAGGVASDPVVAGDLVVFGTSAGVVYALQLASGQLVWRATLGNGPLAGVTVDRGSVLAVGEGIALHALELRTGAVLWEAPIRGGSYAAPAAAPPEIYVAGDDGMIHVLDGGKASWQTALPASMPVRVTLTPELLLVSVLADRSLRALDRSTHAERWAYTLAGPAGVAPRAPAPVVVGGTAVVGDGGNLLGLTLATGATAWTVTVGGDAAAALVVGDVALATGRDGGLHAVDAATGKLLWTTRLGEPVTSGLAFVDGQLFAVDAARQLTAMTP